MIERMINSMRNNKNKYLQESEYIDYSHPAVLAYSLLVTGRTKKQKAISIYYLVRDNIRYNPYTIAQGKRSLKASFAASQTEAYCIPKAALMVALCRYFKIPARIGFADVENHISSQKLLDLIGTRYFSMHGYAEIYLHKKWIKATPIFNLELCEKFDITPLDFDGEHEAIFQEYTASGQKYMEYIVDHGAFAEVPVEFIYENFKKHYPHLADTFLSQTNQSEKGADL